MSEYARKPPVGTQVRLLTADRDRVVAKLDAWLKSHDDGAYEDYLEDVKCELENTAEVLVRIAELLEPFIANCMKATELLGSDYFDEEISLLPDDLRSCVSILTQQIKPLDLALSTRERAS